MDLTSILNQMSPNDDHTKTASEQPADNGSHSELAAALEKVAGTIPAAPAADDSPINGLVKMAHSLAQSEEARDVAHAAQCGAAFADAAVAKFAAFEAQAQAEVARNGGALKQASAPVQGLSAEDVQKIAAATVIDTLEYLAQQENGSQEKMAAEYQQGYDAALQQTFDAAYGEFFKGAQEAAIICNKYAQAQQ